MNAAKSIRDREPDTASEAIVEEAMERLSEKDLGADEAMEQKQ